MNDSVCFPIDEYNAARPGNNLLLTHVSYGVLSIQCICILMTSPLLFILQDEPMFFKIRPPRQLFFNNIVTCIALCGYILPPVTPNFSCALELVIHVLGAAFVVPTFTQRALLFCVESEHTLRIQLNAFSPSNTQRPTIFTALKTFFQIGLRQRRFENLTLTELISMRLYKNSIFAMFGVPPLVVLMFCVGLIPRFSQGCVQCPLTLEFLLLVLGPTSPGILVNFNVIFYALFRKCIDLQYVRLELSVMLFLGCLFVYTGYGLELGDPGRFHYDRVFSWRLLLSMGPFSFWLCNCAAPIVTALLYLRERERTPIVERMSSYNAKSDFLQFLQQDMGLFDKFRQFTIRRMCVENLNFMQAVYEFEKINTSVEKAEYMRKTFIAIGAEQEVNISHNARVACLEKDLATCMPEELLLVFRESYEEVRNMVITGTWTDFTIEERKSTKSLRVAVEEA